MLSITFKVDKAHSMYMSIAVMFTVMALAQKIGALVVIIIKTDKTDKRPFQILRQPAAQNG